MFVFSVLLFVMVIVLLLKVGFYWLGCSLLFIVNVVGWLFLLSSMRVIWWVLFCWQMWQNVVCWLVKWIGSIRLCCSVGVFLCSVVICLSCWQIGFFGVVLMCVWLKQLWLFLCFVLLCLKLIFELQQMVGMLCVVNRKLLVLMKLWLVVFNCVMLWLLQKVISLYGFWYGLLVRQRWLRICVQLLFGCLNMLFMWLCSGKLSMLMELFEGQVNLLMLFGLQLNVLLYMKKFGCLVWMWLLNCFQNVVDMWLMVLMWNVLLFLLIYCLQVLIM